ncbi:hypothetical protein [Sphingomonas faeni]|uniref:hypothetical protein n=1 Tax=Sphingomonas faeni TaxID=185950 RepID=UPI002780D664|nr:hypothetical protein [Sphingomonas faeni]MDQ0839416.1 hypothetical protein [Sphingomonas faeni]
MADTTWITPAAAERLVASYVEADSIVSVEAMFQLSAWIIHEQLSTLSLEATRWEDKPAAIKQTENNGTGKPEAQQAPAPPSASEDGSASPLVAYRVNPTYRPVSAEQLPLHKIRVTNYVLTPRDWHAINTSEADQTTMWASSEITHTLADQRHPHARVTYSGIRMSREDIENRIAIAGWPEPTPQSAVSVGQPDAQGAAPATPTPAPPATKGGRKPHAFWEPLLVEMARQLYVGDLDPKAQADIEKAMHDWLVANSYEAGETAVRERASRLWAEIR